MSEDCCFFCFRRYLGVERKNSEKDVNGFGKTVRKCRFFTKKITKIKKCRRLRIFCLLFTKICYTEIAKTIN